MIKNILATCEKLGYQRDINFVMNKMVEELGEMSVEVNILNGFLPKEKGGKDGVIGEGNDIINCAIDLIYLTLKQQNPELTIDQIADMIEQNQKVKCEKWLRVALFS